MIRTRAKSLLVGGLMQTPTPHNNDEFRCSNVEVKRILYSVAIVLDFIQTVWIFDP